MSIFEIIQQFFVVYGVVRFLGDFFTEQDTAYRMRMFNLQLNQMKRKIRELESQFESEQPPEIPESPLEELE